MFTRKLNSHHKPVGKAVLTGFKLEFNAGDESGHGGQRQQLPGGLGVDQARQEEDREGLSSGPDPRAVQRFATTP